MNSKILLFGGSGYLGSNLKKLKRLNIISPTHNKVNLQKTNDVLEFIDKTKPNVIVYAAGITKIDFAEKNKDLTYKLNYQLAKTISKHASINNILFIYISTDAVFDGYKRKFEFTEIDKPNAISTYGKSKLRGEDAVLKANSNNLILRVINFFGGKDKDNFASEMISNLMINKNYYGIVDQIQNPLNVRIATQAIGFSIKNNFNGIYNLGALDYDTNFNFLVKIAKAKKLDSDLIKKISFEDFMKNKNGHRKQKSVLIVDKFNNASQKRILKDIDQSVKLFSL